MTPKEKSKEIYYKFLNILVQNQERIIKKYLGLNMEAISIQTEVTCEHVKKCALLHVDEILKLELVQPLMKYDMNYVNVHDYYSQVKEEIEKL